MRSRYYLEGTMTLPEAKRDELYENVMRLLKRTGIRKCAEREVAGEKFTVLEQPKRDEDGKVWFDYSIFEKHKREAGCYDYNTGELTVPSHGGLEYGVAMNLIWVLCEAYSSTPCYLVNDGKVMSVYGYLRVLKYVLGWYPELRWRRSYVSLKRMLKSHDIEFSMDNIIEYAALSQYADFDIDEFVVALLAGKPIERIREEASITGCQDILACYEELVEEMYKDSDGTLARLTDLIFAPYMERKQIADAAGSLSSAAKISLSQPPVCLVMGYAFAASEAFDDLWVRFCPYAYTDWQSKGHVKVTEISEYPLYKVIRRENEDEFLEIRSSQDGIVLSSEIKANLEKWQNEYLAIRSEGKGQPPIDMVKSMHLLLDLLYNSWKTRFVSADFVDEFLSIAGDDRYQAAMRLILSVVIADAAVFPEVTSDLACQILTPKIHTDSERSTVMALISVMTNHSQRLAFFGF